MCGEYNLRAERTVFGGVIHICAAAMGDGGVAGDRRCSRRTRTGVQRDSVSMSCGDGDTMLMTTIARRSRPRRRPPTTIRHYWRRLFGSLLSCAYVIESHERASRTHTHTRALVLRRTTTRQQTLRYTHTPKQPPRITHYIYIYIFFVRGMYTHTRTDESTLAYINNDESMRGTIHTHMRLAA